jgi:hypothetical protein
MFGNFIRNYYIRKIEIKKKPAGDYKEIVNDLKTCIKVNNP